MDSSPAPQKKGLGGLAWLGIGCGGIIVLVVIGAVIFFMLFGARIKQYGVDAMKNPTRTAVTTAITVSGGKLELVAEDDAHLRYTLREKQSGKLTTIFWNAKSNTIANVPGDFSAVPADAASTPEPVPK